jgi:hypothetical protein
MRVIGCAVAAPMQNKATHFRASLLAVAAGSTLDAPRLTTRQKHFDILESHQYFAGNVTTPSHTFLY